MTGPAPRRLRRTLVGLLAVAGLVAPAATASAATSPSPSTSPGIVSPSVAGAPAGVSLVLSNGAARAAATEFARRHGLAVVSSTGSVVQLAGPAGRLAALFGTTVHAERRAGRQHLVHDRPLSVPADLSGQVTAAVGLDDRPLFRPLSIPIRGLTPTDLQSTYHLPAASDRGAGITVATVQFSNWDPNDAATYASAAGIPLPYGKVTTVLTGNVADIVTDTQTNGASEVSLDVEALLATAPGANQRVYVAGNTSGDATAAYGRILQDVRAGLVQVVSTSWGQCEGNMDPSDITTVSGIMAQIVAAGATVFAASGDNGADDCFDPDPSVNDYVPGVDYPASDPAVVGVGGTVLSSTTPEQAWSGSGGGPSDVFDRPVYQAGLPGALATRTVPDVSSVAGTGFAIYAQGAWTPVGGTSLAAPTWAGGLAAALPAAGCTRGAGDLHRLLYANRTRLLDITDGNNDHYGYGGYLAGVGYDPVTGLGTPQWDQLAAPLAQHCAGVGYVPLRPARILDTRTSGSTLGPGTTLDLKVTGMGGVPSKDVSAVVLNLTATNVTDRGFVAAFPAGTAMPTASNLNVVPGQTAANLVTVPVGADGRVSLFNEKGDVDLVADVEAYYLNYSGGLRFDPLTPARLLDTRTTNGGHPGALAAGKTLTLQVTGRGGVPRTTTPAQATAVLINLTGTHVTADTYVTAWAGGTRPLASNLNLSRGATRANLVSVPLSSTGTISLFNGHGSADLVVDVVGFYGPTGDVVVPVAPVRILDSRSGVGVPAGVFRGGVPETLQVTGQAGVPAGADSVIANVTAVAGPDDGHLTVYPYGSALPNASTLNWAPDQTVPNLAAIRLGGGKANFVVNTGYADVVADLAGYTVP